MMDFADALRALKEGKCVARTGWRGQWLVLVKHVGANASDDETGYVVVGYPDRERCHYLAWIGLGMPNKGFVPWNFTHEDVLAEDWMITYPLH